MNPRYQEWLKQVFDHEVKEMARQWYFDDGFLKFEASPGVMTELLGQTFLRAGIDLKEYSDAKVDQGIWYMASISGSNFMLPLASSEVPVAKRLEAIGNIYYLYSDCYAKRCAETLAHLSEEGSPLNSSCYMFWDICNLEDMLESKETQHGVWEVLAKILTIEHRACREGALHGLGHAFYACPEKVREIIDDFLSKTKLDNFLLAYALKARDGNVQ
jgi:hypothetical protein